MASVPENVYADIPKSNKIKLSSNLVLCNPSSKSVQKCESKIVIESSAMSKQRM